MMKLEVCANSIASAKAAEAAGAHRIELCSELSLGGVTPSYGLLKMVNQALSIPVFALIRPRSGDFTYSNDEFGIMKEDINIAKELGCQGIVSGVLTDDFRVDEERTKQLIDLAAPLPFTFHRAFDWLVDPEEGLQQLKRLGAKRILTSGQQQGAGEGIDLLKSLQAKAGEQLLILPGGGVTAANAHLFVGHFKEVHRAALKSKKSLTSHHVSFNSETLADEGKMFFSDETEIRNTLAALKGE